MGGGDVRRVYEDYVTACAEAAIKPLSPDQVVALVHALLALTEPPALH
jgi:hypothetical protein